MQQKIEQSTDVLKAIISPVMHEGDVKWPPREPGTLKLMEKVRPHLSAITYILSWSLYVICNKKKCTVKMWWPM